MPNPLLRMPYRPSKTNTDRPHEIAPEVEHVSGDNNPYRGLEPHGVEPNAKPHDPNTYGVDPNNPNQGHIVNLEEPPVIPEPVPVRVVNTYKEELRRLGTDRFNLDFTAATNPAARPAELCGRSTDRATVRIRNCDAANIVLVAGTREDIAMKGFPIYPGQEVSLETEDPLFATVVSSTYGVPTTVTVVGVIYQYRIKEA